MHNAEGDSGCDRTIIGKVPHTTGGMAGWRDTSQLGMADVIDGAQQSPMRRLPPSHRAPSAFCNTPDQVQSLRHEINHFMCDMIEPPRYRVVSFTDVAPFGRPPPSPHVREKPICGGTSTRSTQYLDGVPVGSGGIWRVAQHYTDHGQLSVRDVRVLRRGSGHDTTTAGVILATEVHMRPSGRETCTAGRFSS
ncbi:hypothetical protein DFH09DRAFT_1079842 [Mycena vulgaris]|nr:hypothetical protein DFH09DRAFT_1079842 [Mycena vulgaris]